MTDAKKTLSEEQVITADTTTVDSTNQVDLGDIEDNRQVDVAAGERGPLEDIYLQCYTGLVAHTVAGDLTITIQDATALGGSFAVLVPTISLVRAQATYLAAGQANATGTGVLLLDVRLPRFMRRAIKMVYETGADWSSNLGTINCFLTWGQNRNRALAS